MGNPSKTHLSRRGFLSLRFRPGNAADGSGETVKMLTADGKLVEVDKSIAEQFTTAPAAGNSEILEWMENPSKKEDSQGTRNRTIKN